MSTMEQLEQKTDAVANCLSCAGNKVMVFPSTCGACAAAQVSRGCMDLTFGDSLEEDKKAQVGWISEQD
nr:hypothetical protein Iba_chr06aCG6780 [Ipomoea batatas]